MEEQSSNVIPFGGAVATTDDSINSAFKFDVGNLVAGIYVAGKVVNLPEATTNDKLFYSVKINDADERINGKYMLMHESELDLGTTPQYITNHEYAISPLPEDKDALKNRKRTYGELCVGLSYDNSVAIDSIASVFAIKRMFAQLIDEVQFVLRTNEKEIVIASQTPTQELGANVAVVDSLRESINDIVALKCRTVNGAIGNNDKC